MKSFITVLLVVLACLCLVKDADAWNPPKGSDRNTCGHKNPNVVNAIETFCFGNNNLVSSRTYGPTHICAKSLTHNRLSPLTRLEMVKNPGRATSS
jgi:hypothetical protein